MNNQKIQQWAKWHKKGYRTWMFTHLGVVLAFYAFTGTVAYTQLYLTMPEGVKERGGGVPIWPAVLVIGIMTPLSIVFSHFMWKRNESKYLEHESNS